MSPSSRLSSSLQLTHTYYRSFVKRQLQLLVNDNFHSTVGIWIAKLFGIQIREICSLVKWFAIPMPDTMLVWYSDHHLVNKPDIRRQFVYCSAIQMPSTIIPGIWIANHLNNKQVKSCYSDVSYLDPHWTKFSLSFSSFLRKWSNFEVDPEEFTLPLLGKSRPRNSIITKYFCYKGMQIDFKHHSKTQLLKAKKSDLQMQFKIQTIELLMVKFLDVSSRPKSGQIVLISDDVSKLNHSIIGHFVNIWTPSRPTVVERSKSST